MMKATKYVVIGAMILIIMVANAAYYEGTKHQVTITVESLDKTPSKDGDGSNYLVHNKERLLVELQRGWYFFGDNIDLLYDDLNAKKGQQVTLDCYGWYMPQFYWYHMCYKME